MAINLIKGQRVEIESGLTRLKVEMGWKVNPNADPAYDLDASTFLLGSNGQIENEYDFLFLTLVKDKKVALILYLEKETSNIGSRKENCFSE